MSRKQNFNQSIKYAMPLIEDADFKRSVYFLLSRLINVKVIREKRWLVLGKYLDNYLTILKNPNFCRKDCENSTKDGKDYRLYNLTRTAKIQLTNTYKKSKFTNGVALFFNDKYSCKEFLKDVGIRANDVIFGAYLAKFEQYEVVIRFKNGITQKQKAAMLGSINYIFNRSDNRYHGARADDHCLIPATIYDRWFDPFTQKVLWNANDIKNTFNNSVNYSDFMSKILTLRAQYIRNSVKNTSRVSYFISNIDKIKPEFLKSNLYIVNHYINKYNPYVRKDARKDWKFAAEQYLNEMIGKLKYRLLKIDEDFKDCQEHFIKNDVDIKLNLEFVEDNKKYVERMESRLDTLTDEEKIRLKFSKENIDIYTKIAEKYKEEAIERAREYINKRIKDYYVLFFSKKETEYFINKLNLKTKISGVKLRKIVLDVIKELGILNVKEEYRSKVFCRKYELVKERFVEFYNFIKAKFSSFNFILIKYYYMLKNSLADKELSASDWTLLSKVKVNLSGPPD